MSSSQKKAIRNAHARKYIEDVFANRLKEEGFFCPDDRLLCWYRVLNDEVLHTVCFFSCWSNVPLIISIAYGIHPLFEKPFHSTDISSSRRPEGSGFVREELREAGPRQSLSPYAPDALVYAPDSGGRGLYTLEEMILPVVNNVRTLDQCYRYHLDASPSNLDLAYPKCIVDEAIYLNDTASFADCLQKVEARLEYCGALHEKYPANREYAELLQAFSLQKKTICEDRREEYVAMLEKKKQKIMASLKK